MNTPELKEEDDKGKDGVADDEASDRAEPGPDAAPVVKRADVGGNEAGWSRATPAG